MKTLKDFLVSKEITMDAFKEMSAEKQAELMNEHNTAQKKAFEALENDGKTTKEELDAFKTQIQEERNEQAEALNKTLKEMGLAIKKLSDSEKKEKSNIESIKSSLEANKDKLIDLASGDMQKAQNGQISIKAVGDMLSSTNVSGGDVPVEDRLSGLNMIPSRRIRLMDLVSRGSTTSNVVSWVYQANQDGAVNYTAEGAAKNQIDFDLIVDSEKVEKITAYVKVSDEMVSDIDYIESTIRLELVKELLKKLETEVYSGAGTSGTLNGIRTVATAFAAGSFASEIDEANDVDVLTVALNQIDIAEHEGATAILMHPTDVTRLKMVKVSSTDKRYVERLAMIAGSLSLDGVPIIPTTLVTAGEYLVGDFTKVMVLDRQSVRIDVGLDGNDFTKNMRTIRAEWRGTVVTKQNDRTALVKGVFATDKAALETV